MKTKIPYGKKSQMALEFALIMVFVLTIVTLLMAVLGTQAINLQEHQEKKYLNDYMSTIENEISVMNEMEEGYYREVKIPKPIERKYNLTKKKDTFIVTRNTTGENYYYTYSYTGEIGIFNKTITLDGKTINYRYIYFARNTS